MFLNVRHVEDARNGKLTSQGPRLYRIGNRKGSNVVMFYRPWVKKQKESSWSFLVQSADGGWNLELEPAPPPCVSLSKLTADVEMTVLRRGK